MSLPANIDFKSLVNDTNVRGLAAILAGSDHAYIGTAYDLPTNHTTVFGELVYIGASGLEKCDGNLAATMPPIGIVVEAGITAGNPARICTDGLVRDDTWTWTSGNKIYPSGTPGALVSTPLDAGGDQVPVIGVAVHADVILVRPNTAFAEV